ncbi:hypothetical protein Mal64_14040 [Pseudobythopirellula maris]|uniref:Uncharacterized protein n=1 Tax=Pseudobythopirellula maris TaxID=2527991 RepID=A0A5C5ZV61_9BACT|nr:hypothetical protein [Pseudobythopirellula maris]TWT91005.1 hypothetical protein Mal64_14040 [Pseudobythopirellula maris]
MTPLTDEQQREACLILAVGCDRETAAKYVGCRVEDLDRQADSDADFQQRLRRAEASPELAHMRNIQQAGREEKNWRASVWWLERLAPERFARRDFGAVTRAELKRFIEALAEHIACEVQDEEDRSRLLERLRELIVGVNEEDDEIEPGREPPARGAADASEDSSTPINPIEQYEE